MAKGQLNRNEIYSLREFREIIQGLGRHVTCSWILNSPVLVVGCCKVETLATEQSVRLTTLIIRINVEGRI